MVLQSPRVVAVIGESEPAGMGPIAWGCSGEAAGARRGFGGGVARIDGQHAIGRGKRVDIIGRLRKILAALVRVRTGASVFDTISNRTLMQASVCLKRASARFLWRGGPF
jgi:hypothetical protein